jgi:hypothetical protein
MGWWVLPFPGWSDYGGSSRIQTARTAPRWPLLGTSLIWLSGSGGLAATGPEAGEACGTCGHEQPDPEANAGAIAKVRARLDQMAEHGGSSSQGAGSRLLTYHA